ncbi:hypothetical protein QTP88_027849 [Uroleucon formosanum]
MEAQSANNHGTTKTISTSSKRNLSSSSLSPKSVDKKLKIFITSNRYSVLTTLNDSSNYTQPNKTQTHTQKITPKPPAVYIKGVKNDLLMIALILDEEEEEKAVKKRMWVHKAWKKRPTEGEFSTLYKELMDDGTKFFEYFSECVKERYVYNGLEFTEGLLALVRIYIDGFN